MKVYCVGNVEYWYDPATKCWWRNVVDDDGFQVGSAEHAYSKAEIIRIANHIKDRK